jgi:aminoglycoside 6'-N-acetyltransferase I
MVVVREITLSDDLGAVVTQINAATWDEANDMAEYRSDALRAYLGLPGTVFIVCHQSTGTESQFLGMASARLEMKPYDHEKWLYVDEIDVAVDQRRLGAGSAMMNYLLSYAADNDCTELWLGTEIDNQPARSLYQSLDPDESEAFVGFAYEIDGTDYR